MKIVQINTVCGTGSTGKIALDLYHLAEDAGHTCYFAFGRGTAPTAIRSYKIGNFFDFGCHVILNFLRGKSGFGSNHVTKQFLKWLDQIHPDLLHLHNLHGFYLNIAMLFTYIKANHIKVVWTLHDCWPFTGQCAHFDYAGCSKWITGCHDCPIYRSDYPYSLFCDNSRQNYIQKKAAFTGVKDMTIVTPSFWLASLVKQSYLQEYPVKVIPNGINLEIFCPSHSDSKSLTLPSNFENKKIILGVANVWTKRKGLDFFFQLHKDLPDAYHIVLIGLSKRQQQKIHSQYGDAITALTKTTSQQALADWYRSAYVFVNPTLEDNFPTTNLEALACGTPVITFRTGGSPESISDKCGIIVDKGNIIELKEAILSLSENSNITSAACREQAMKFNSNVNFQEYLRFLDI